MKLSGFTMVKNATKLYYPIRQSIESVLPIVDEFIVALGDCDADDHTRTEINKINSEKVRIIDTVWDTEAFPNGTENAHQTDIAKNACTGDWCLYLQADEVIHEQYLDEIVQKCEQYLKDVKVDGFLFNYRHFWGDFDHYVNAHGWYPNEIRIVRNDPDVHSYKSAQSFRRIPNFDGRHYRQEKGTYKLNVIALNAYIYHYGWVRPPHLMQQKRQALDSIHKGKEEAAAMHRSAPAHFDYGDLNKLPHFTGTHPKVMQEWISKSDWKDELDAARQKSRSKKHKHEKLKNRLLTFIEQKLMNGRQLFGHKNWKVVRR